MSNKVIIFGANPKVRLVEKCVCDVNTRNKRVYYKPPDENETCVSIGFNEIFIKHKNVLCVFDCETKICRLAAIYPNENECENYYNFIESNKKSLSINEKEVKLLYKNNFLMVLLALKIDEPSIFAPALDVVISGLLELKLNEPASPPLPKVPEPTKTPVPSCMLPKWILPIKCANYSKMDDEAPVNLDNVSTPKNKPSQTFQPATSSVPRCEPKLQNSSSPLKDENKEAANREAFNKNHKESNLPTTTDDDNHRSTTNSQKPERTAINEQQYSHREPKEPFTPVASQSHDDTPRPKITTTTPNSNSHHRKSSRFNDDDSDRENEEPNIKKRRSSFDPNVPRPNIKILKPPQYFFKNVLNPSSRIVKHLMIMAPNSDNSLAYEYEVISKSKGKYRCIKCFKRENGITVSATFYSELDEVTLGTNQHICEPKTCEPKANESLSNDDVPCNVQ